MKYHLLHAKPFLRTFQSNSMAELMLNEMNNTIHATYTIKYHFIYTECSNKKSEQHHG